MFPKFNKSKSVAKTEEKRTAVYRAFLRKEAEIGGKLFGPVPKGGRREFFCLDEHTVIWHEEWIGSKGQNQVRTTRYDIRPNGILKAQNGQHYQMVSLGEAKNLRDAVQLYVERVKNEVYSPTAQYS